MIRIVFAMVTDLLVFFLLFAIQLMAFSCVGILSFGNLTPYETLESAVVMLFETAMGNWNFRIYDDLEDKKYYGIFFHVIIILVNTLLLLNFVIAIMTDTYANLAELKLGLFAQGIVEAIPSYKNHKRYGGLIVMLPPFNLLAFVLLPIYLTLAKAGRSRLE